ncbi:MAG: DUF885 domain-containing protein [Lysobacterales bacterium]|jgi:hypothetical protein
MTQKRPLLQILTAVAAGWLLTACKPADSPGAGAPGGASGEDQPPNAQWEPFVDRYIESFLAAHPAFAVVQGRHEYDGQLQDWSAEGIAREIARLKALRLEATEFGDDELNEQQRFEREYLLAAIDRSLFWLDKAEWPFRNPAFYFDWMSDSLDPSPYITLDYAPLEERIKSYTRYARSVVRAADQIRANLRMPMARTVLQFGIDSFGGMANYYENDVPAVFAAVEDAGLQSDFAAANSAAAAAMHELTAWLKSNLDTATEDYALGPDLFRQMIYDTERVDIPLDQLEAMGRKDLLRNQAALADACAEFAPGKSIAECFAKMAARKPPGGPVETARVQLKELRAFVVEHDLVSIPGNERALVAEAPPYARSNGAYINIPGPYSQNQPSIYYIAPPNPEWSAEVQQAYIPGEADLLFTSVHEVWPGHFLNFVHAKRSNWFFGRIFVTYAFAEGWAHYTEEMMLEAGLRGASPETRIGEIGNALLRDVRFLSAIGLHTQGMTVEESERMFMEEAYQSKGTAMQQAARGTYDPAYLNYTMGKLMIRQLRDDWTRDRGGRAAWKSFHDTFLSFGGPPIPLVRARMLKQN